jgi:hypothetical protein
MPNESLRSQSALLAQHAQHVVLIHFPIALFLAGAGFDIAARWTKRATNRATFAAAAPLNILAAAVFVLPTLATGVAAWQWHLGGAEAQGTVTAPPRPGMYSRCSDLPGCGNPLSTAESFSPSRLLSAARNPCRRGHRSCGSRWRFSEWCQCCRLAPGPSAICCEVRPFDRVISHAASRHTQCKNRRMRDWCCACDW